MTMFGCLYCSLVFNRYISTQPYFACSCPSGSCFASIPFPTDHKLEQPSLKQTWIVWIWSISWAEQDNPVRQLFNSIKKSSSTWQNVQWWNNRQWIWENMASSISYLKSGSMTKASWVQNAATVTLKLLRGSCPIWLKSWTWLVYEVVDLLLRDCVPSMQDCGTRTGSSTPRWLLLFIL